jgi:membrane protein implicated in regulation of membrane protease activity
VAKTDIKGKGKGYGHGGLWNAEADEPMAADEKVIVIVVRSMTVKVKKERGAVW